MHFRSYALLGLLVAAALTLSPAKADSATPGMNARDEAMASFAAFLSEPPVVDVIATLEPPVTTYRVEMSGEWFAQYEALAKELDAVGVKSGHSGPKYGEFRWAGEVSCGELIDPKAWQFRWVHPDRPPKECPHEQGTDHPGTITVTNLFFRFALREEVAADEGVPTNEAMATMDAAPRLAEYVWTLECRYADGSKSGRARCTGALRTGQDAAGGSAATNTNTAGQGQGSGAGAAGAAAGAVAVGAAGYWWWRRPFDWQDIQRRWKMK